MKVSTPEVICHTDMTGTTIEIGNVLAMSHRDYNEVVLGRVTGFTLKRVRVEYLGMRGERIIHPATTIIVEGPNVMAYVLKNSG